MTFYPKIGRFDHIIGLLKKLKEKLEKTRILAPNWKIIKYICFFFFLQQNLVLFYFFKNLP